MEPREGTMLLRAMGAGSLGAGLLLVWLAAHAGTLFHQPWLLAGPLLVAGLRLWPWVAGAPLGEFSYGNLVRGFTFGGHSEAPAYGQPGRLTFLLCGPVILAMIALLDPDRYRLGLDLYLLLLALVGSFAMAEHDGLLTDIVATAGWVFLASLDAGAVATLLALLAGGALLHGITLYLFQLHYRELELPAARQLLRLGARLLAAIWGGDVLLALAGTAACHGVGQLARLWFGWQREDGTGSSHGFITVLLQRIAAELTALLEQVVGADTPLAIALRVGIFLVLTVGLIWLALRLWRYLSRQGRAGRGGFRLQVLRQVAANPLLAPGYDLTGDWTGTRRALIALYLRTRAQLAKLGYDLRISATPQEYAHFLGGRIPPADADLQQLTELFQAARYAPAPPSEAHLATARAMQQRILAEARKLR